MKTRKYDGILPKTMIALKNMSVTQLNDLWRHYFTSNRPQIRPLWYKIQCEQGGVYLEQKYITKLNAYSKNPAECMGRAHNTKYHIKPGTQLIKKFKGKEHLVTVTSPDKFTYNGQTYNSLSAIAMLICGHKVSGYDFFGFNNKTLNINKQ